ncbi:hypothetical protein GCM10027056_05400 [Glaciibacter psychrotolerans]
MPQDQLFSHVTAARLHEMPLPRFAQTDVLHVTAVKPGRAPRGAGVVGHTLDRWPDVTWIKGVRVVAAAQVWCELATVLSLDDLVAAGDRLLGYRSPLATRQQVASAVIASAGNRGAKKLRAAFELIRERVESPRETWLRLLIVRAGLPEPETNLEIPMKPGRKRVRGDLMYPKYKVLVEYDGEQHRTDSAQYARDVERLAHIAEEGWIHIRVLKSTRVATALADLDRALRSRGWLP